MLFEDIVYVVCLLLCIAIGPFYSKVKDDFQRKLIGTAFGGLIVLIVSGISIIYILISFLIGALIITQVHPRQSHIACFAFMFSYLLFFRTTTYYGFPEPPTHTNMIQMILTLKLVGLAFEINSAYSKVIQRNEELTKKKDDKFNRSESLKNPSTSVLTELTEYDIELQKIDFIEVFHYSFNYIGVLVGPYYRYRTYRDYFETPFRNYTDSINQTITKLKWTSLYLALYLFANYMWPISYAMTDEFYEKRSVIYRLLFVWPTFFIFRMRMYSGLCLSECVCMAAGFGGYPDEADVANGEGPRKHYLYLKRNPESLRYNFNTIKNIDVFGTESCITFREAMKHWNICVQYWLAVNIYKRFPSKKYRTTATLLVSAFWHGIHPGHYFCIMGAPMYLPIENLWYNLFSKNNHGKFYSSIIKTSFWISKFFTFSYLSMAFLLLNFNNFWKYYGSVYYLGHIYWIVLVIVGLRVRSKQKNKKVLTKLS